MTDVNAIQSASLETMLGRLIDGHESVLRELGVADLATPRELSMRPQATNVIRRLSCWEEVEFHVGMAHHEIFLLLSVPDLKPGTVLDLLRMSANIREQGIIMRVLLREETNAGDPALRAPQAAMKSLLGENLRVTDEVFNPLIIVDGNLVLLLDEGNHAAQLVTEQNIVKFLVHAWMIIWSQSKPMFSSENPDQEKNDEDEFPLSLRAAITSLLIDGATDRIVAKRLGISMRSVQSHVAALRTDMGASSRLQLGYLLRHYSTSYRAVSGQSRADWQPGRHANLSRERIRHRRGGHRKRIRHRCCRHRPPGHIAPRAHRSATARQATCAAAHDLRH